MVFLKIIKSLRNYESIKLNNYMEGVPDLLIEDDDEPVEACQQEEDHDEAVSHDLVAGLDGAVVLLQLLCPHVNVVFASILR